MKRSILATATAVVLAALTTAPVAFARPHSNLKLAVPSQSTAGQPIPFSIASAGVLPGDALLIQRQQGTAHSWRTVAVVGRHVGKLPALPMGRYNVRVIELTHRSHRVYGENDARLRVFGTVPLSVLFAGSYTAGTVNLPGSTFTFVDYLGPGGTATIQAAANDCRSVHFDVAYAYPNLQYYPTYNPPAGVLTVTQETADPQATTIAPNAIGALDAFLVVGQSWSVNGQADPGHVFLYDLNGSASCLSATPLAPSSGG
jgi:hypothetical protein